MSKEIQYQNEAQAFIERQSQAVSGLATPMYSEEWSQQYNAYLQEGVSPLIRDVSAEPALVRHGIVGLAQKIREFNEPQILAFIEKHKLSLSVPQFVNILFDDFNNRHKSAYREEHLFTLIFVKPHELTPTDQKWRRQARIGDVAELFDYNVIYYETPGAWKGKNTFFTIRERRIPVTTLGKSSERPDFLHYVNGIPLVLIEYKTENSGIRDAFEDFEIKQSYRCAPFKAAINDGREVVVFSNIEALKLKQGSGSTFSWNHYIDATRQYYPGGREFTNAEYFFNELICNPENMYLYCMHGCAATTHGSKSYLVNARIQQYFALKSIVSALLSAKAGGFSLPFNYLFSHAQRSGKTITMKLLCYLIARDFSDLYSTIFIYVPDLQIKSVLDRELKKTGNSLAAFTVIETRQQYVDAVRDVSLTADTTSSFKVYLVNTQKLTEDGELPTLRVTSKRVLNIIDEAHHGQAKDLASLREKVFPYTSNFLFTATAKDSMYSFYFPDNNKEGFQDKFTISDSLSCGITVPVNYLKADKTFKMSDKLEKFARELEIRTAANVDAEAAVYDVEAQGPLDNFATKQIRTELVRTLAAETIPDKVAYVCAFLDSIKVGLPFSPKGIIYVDGVEHAKKVIAYIQGKTGTNTFKGYRFGVDFAALNEETCPLYNDGLKDSAAVQAAFERDALPGSNDVTFDVLVAVDKYQKGFDLHELMATFLDTSIKEPARMNQIYTRTATKRMGKNQGYCVDLTLATQNAETFKQSMALYDAADAKAGFIDDDTVAAVTAELRAGFDTLMAALGLPPEQFDSTFILNSVLNEPNYSTRKTRQEVFFYTSRNIFRALSKIGSPLFYRPFLLELKALSTAFVAFKEIYGDHGHPEYAKISMEITEAGSGGAYFSSAEIKRIIGEVLAFVDASNLVSLLEFSYVKNKHSNVAADEEVEALKERARNDKKVEDLKKTFDVIGSALHASHRSLYDQIRVMLLRITEDRALTHDADVQDQLTEMMARLEALRKEMREVVARDYAGNELLYWLTVMCRESFRSHEVFAPIYEQYVVSTLEGRLKVFLPRLDSKEPRSERVRDCVTYVLEKFSNFSSFYSSHPDPEEKAVLTTKLKAILAATPAGLKPFNTDPLVFEGYLRKALDAYFGQDEALA